MGEARRARGPVAPRALRVSGQRAIVSSGSGKRRRARHGQRQPRPLRWSRPGLTWQNEPLAGESGHGPPNRHVGRTPTSAARTLSKAAVSPAASTVMVSKSHRIPPAVDVALLTKRRRGPCFRKAASARDGVLGGEALVPALVATGDAGGAAAWRAPEPASAARSAAPRSAS